MSIFRDYQIERDAQGKPVRLIWRGDFELVQPPHYLTCPRCGSERMQAQRCFKCWWTPTNTEPQWRRA